MVQIKSKYNIRFSYKPKEESEIMKGLGYKIIDIKEPTYKGELGSIYYTN